MISRLKSALGNFYAKTIAPVIFKALYQIKAVPKFVENPFIDAATAADTKAKSVVTGVDVVIRSRYSILKEKIASLPFAVRFSALLTLIVGAGFAVYPLIMQALHYSIWLLLPILIPICYIQNMAFTASSRSRNSGDPAFHRHAAWASNGVYIVTHFTILGLVFETLMHSHSIALLIATGVVYTLSTTEGSVRMMKIMIAKEAGKRAVGKFTQEEADEIRRVVKAFKTEVLTVESFGKDGAHILAHMVELFKAKQAQLKAMDEHFAAVAEAEAKAVEDGIASGVIGVAKKIEGAVTNEAKKVEEAL